MSLGNAAQAIITKGLSCGKTTACENGTMLTAGPFTLFCLNPGVAPVGGGGGSYGDHTVTRPLQPGEVQNLYKVLPPEQQLIVPLDQEAQYFKRNMPVTIEVKIGKIDVEKVFMVPKHKARAVFNTIQVLNTTRDKVKVKVTSLKRLITRAVVKVKNITIKRR